MGLDQHVQAHQQAEGVLPSRVVDDRVVDDQPPPGRQGGVGLGQQSALLGEVPVVQDVAHDDHVGRRHGIGEEVPGGEAHAVLQAVFLHIGVEHGLHDRKVETGARQVRMRLGDRHRRPALGAADIDERLDLVPRKQRRHRVRRRQADPGHPAQEALQDLRVGIDDREQVFAAVLGLVLRQAGLQRLGQPVPEPVEPLVGHFQDAADIAGLGPIQVQRGLRRIGVGAGRIPVQHAERHQRVEEVTRRARVQLQAPGQFLQRLGTAAQLREHAQFDGAQQRLGAPEAPAELHDPFGGHRARIVHASLLTAPPRRNGPPGRRLCQTSFVERVR